MGANSKIEWTDHTFNPWIGCTRVSEGCVNCYAEAMMDRRLNRVQWGPKGERRLTSDDYWKQPLRWNAEAARLGIRYRVFCASLADIMDAHPSIKPYWRARLWRLIEATPHLDWLPLTKRPENWAQYLPVIEPGPRFSHVRLGVTIEHQPAADARVESLRIATALGWPTFISYEPALGPVDWSFLEALENSWLIAGGESGRNARPPHPDWFRSARDAAALAGTPFFFKQWGEWTEGTDGKTGDATMDRVGKKSAGRSLDGVEHNEFPNFERAAA